MLETKFVGDNFKMMVTAIVVTNIAMSPTSLSPSLEFEIMFENIMKITKNHWNGFLE